jgi:predicted molibdopterin-dependent oxidoreductase YjgC
MPPVQFMHFVMAANKALIESQCVSCGTWVAAGPDESRLAIAELAHHCPVY